MSLGDDAHKNAAGLTAVGGPLALFLGIFILIMMVLVVLPVVIWAWLYPLNLAATIVASGVAALIALQIAHDLSGFNYFLVQIVPPAIVLCVAFVWSARLEQRLGEYWVYWLLRHLTRLFTLAIGTMLLHYYIQYNRACFSESCLIHSVIAGKGIPIILALGAAVAGHFLLTNTGFREMWHDKLDDLKLRRLRATRGGGDWRLLLHAVGVVVLIIGGPLLAMRLPLEPHGSSGSRTTPLRASPAPAKASMVLAPVMREIFGIELSEPTLDAVRRVIVAEGATVNEERDIGFGSRLLLTSGAAAYRVPGLQEVRYTFTEGMLETMSVSRRAPSSPDRVFEERFLALSARFHLEKRDGTFAFFRAPGLQASLSMRGDRITEFYEVVTRRRL